MSGWSSSGSDVCLRVMLVVSWDALSLSSTGRCHASGLPPPFPSSCGPLPVHPFRSAHRKGAESLRPFPHHLGACVHAILVDVPKYSLLRCCWLQELGRSDLSSLFTPRFFADVPFGLWSWRKKGRCDGGSPVKPWLWLFLFYRGSGVSLGLAKNKASLTKAVRPRFRGGLGSWRKHGPTDQSSPVKPPLFFGCIFAEVLEGL